MFCPECGSAHNYESKKPNFCTDCCYNFITGKARDASKDKVVEKKIEKEIVAPRVRPKSRFASQDESVEDDENGEEEFADINYNAFKASDLVMDISLPEDNAVALGQVVATSKEKVVRRRVSANDAKKTLKQYKNRILSKDSIGIGTGS